MRVGGGRAAVALAGLTLSTFVFITSETLPISLLPLLARGLVVPVPAVGLLVSAYAGIVVVATIPLTRLTQRIPRRTLLSIVLAVLVVGTLLGAAAPSYAVLLLARALTALAHAVFWAIVVPIAAALVGPAMRGRAVSTVYAGGSVATVLGIPFATWLGQAVDWRAAFLGCGLVGAIAFGVVTAALPSARGTRAEGSPGTAPDRRRYLLLVLVTALTATGALTAFTYVSPLLTATGGVRAVDVGGVLLVRGAVGLVAVLVAGRLVDRFPRGTILVALGAHAAGLVLLSLAGPLPVLAVVGSVLTGAGFAAFAAVVGALVLAVAPGSVDVATAGTSTAFNVGIASGAFVGGAALSVAGLAAVPLAALALSAAGVVVAAVAARSGGVAVRP